jgi:DNA-directed RNA polymerase specialized sigma24 family protein
VFTRVELEGEPVKLVAEELGIKPDSARQFIHRAYEYLAQALGDQLAKGREGI